MLVERDQRPLLLRFKWFRRTACASDSLGIEFVERSRIILLDRIVEERRLDGHCCTINCLLLGRRKLRNVVRNVVKKEYGVGGIDKDGIVFGSKRKDQQRQGARQAATATKS
jgi:hypothetical protein